MIALDLERCLMADNPWWRIHELKLALGTVEHRLKSGFFAESDAASHEGEAFFTQMLICLNDAVMFLSQNNDRITLDGDVQPFNEKEQDVTDLINRFRNIACHLPSDQRSIGDDMRVGFNVLRGKASMRINGQMLVADYDDDVAFFYGVHRIYLNRHVRAAWTEAVERLKKYQ